MMCTLKNDKGGVLCLFLWIFFCANTVFAQENSLGLQDWIQIARENATGVKVIQASYENSYWDYRSIRSEYRPQLSLSGTAVDYNRRFVEVLQPDGSIRYQEVENNKMSLGMALEQNIAPTGTRVSIRSEWQRFDDFNQDLMLFNGYPILFGIEQPLFRYNDLHWQQKIAPMRLNEAEKTFSEKMERMSWQTCRLYFDLLEASVNKSIAKTNFENTTTLLEIAEVRFELGELSEHDLLQLKLSGINAGKDQAAAALDMETRERILKSFTGYTAKNTIALSWPKDLEHFSLDSEKALQEALENRNQAWNWKRRMTEAEAEVAKAKGESGLSADLSASIGLSKSADVWDGVYQSPNEQQTLWLGLTIPIMDWGRTKSRRQKARVNKELLQYEIEQEKIDFVTEIETEIRQFELLQEQLNFAKEAKEISKQRYYISTERFKTGAIEVSDLNISMSEKDSAQRAYVNALRACWESYYRIRLLTLYDFRTGQKIHYTTYKQ